MNGRLEVKDIEKIQALVGEITPEQLVHVDCAITDELGLFMPIAGQCYYAISPEHVHPSWSFIVSFDSHCRTKKGSNVYESVPSTIFALEPGVPHQELPSQTVSRYIAVLIEANYFVQQLALYAKTSTEISSTMICPSSQRLVDELKEFMGEYEKSFAGYETLLKASALKITHLIIRQFLGITQLVSPVMHRMAVNKALEFLNEHYGEKLTICEMATVANCSTSHFSRIFKEETGLSPSDYIMKVRLEFAKRMLRSDEKTLTEIALECGFNSSSYFSHCFSRAYMISPSDFKKSLILS